MFNFDLLMIEHVYTFCNVYIYLYMLHRLIAINYALCRKYVTELLSQSRQSSSPIANQITENTTQEIPPLRLDVLFVTYFSGLMIVFSLVSLVANILVIAATVITPSLRTVTNYYIIALAVAEALTSLLFMLYTFGTFNPPLIRFIGK